MRVDRNMERLFDSFLNRVPWQDDDYRFVTEDLKDKCVRIAVRNADFLLPFLERAAVKNPYIVSLLLQYYSKKIRLKPAHQEILQNQVRRHFQLQLEQIPETLTPETLVNLRNLLAYGVHTDEKNISHAVLEKVKGFDEYQEFLNFEKKSELTQFFFEFMIMIRNSYLPLINTARFCRAVYEKLGAEECKMLLIQLGGSQHRIEIMIENQESEDLSYLIRSAVEQRTGEKVKLWDFRKEVLKTLETLKMDQSYAVRDLNVGFSGGEKKKVEILQMLLLKPTLAILDETDSGLDVDAVRTVSEGIEEFQKDKSASLLIITHNAAILSSLHVDKVHILVDGSIVRTGGAELIEEIEKDGFAGFGGTDMQAACGETASEEAAK